MRSDLFSRAFAAGRRRTLGKIAPLMASYAWWRAQAGEVEVRLEVRVESIIREFEAVRENLSVVVQHVRLKLSRSGVVASCRRPLNSSQGKTDAACRRHRAVSIPQAAMLHDRSVISEVLLQASILVVFGCAGRWVH